MLTVASPAQAAPIWYQQTPISSDTLNGVGYATAVVGNVAYVGGTFTTVKRGSQTVGSRSNLAAFDVRTGRLITSFKADTNGIVRSLDSDGSALYVGGSFTTVNGTTRRRVAKVNLATGAVDTGFTANANSNVYSLAVGGGRVILGGTFGDVNGSARKRTAVVSATSGSVQAFNPSIDATVNSVEILPNGSKVFLGGNFTLVNGTSRTDLVGLDAGSGAITSPTFSNVKGVALDMDVSDDGRHMGAAIGDYGNEGAYFDLNSGKRLWDQDCGGDAQGVAVIDDSMYTGFHEECDGDATLRLTGNATSNGARDQQFKPTFDKYWGGRSIDGNYDGLVLAGDFTRVSGVSAQGFVIFPLRGAPPATTTTTTTTTVPGPTTTTTTTTTSPPPSGGFALKSSWSYLATSSAAPSTWAASSFDSSSWPTGSAQLGYGEGDEATVVPFGPNHSVKWATTYFRKAFTLSSAPSAAATLSLVADDGAVVYVNGTEVVRDNMPSGTVSYGTLSATGRYSSAENAARSFTIPASAFRSGTNVIAVEVHQETLNSSDLSFDAALSFG